MNMKIKGENWQIYYKKKKKDVSEYSLESANQLLVYLWVKSFFETISGANLGGI